MKIKFLFLTTLLTGFSSALSIPRSAESGIEKRASPPAPNVNGYQFYRQTTSAFVWAVVGVSDWNRMPPTDNVLVNAAGAAGALIGDIQNTIEGFAQTLVQRVASQVEWHGIYNSATNSIGIVVDGSKVAAQVSALEWDQFLQYVEQIFKQTGHGFGYEDSDNVIGLLFAPVKRGDLDVRADTCAYKSVSVLHTMTSKKASLPEGSFGC